MTSHARMFIFTCLVFLGTVLCLSGPAPAAIYKWTDETGKTHYTNDKSKIPRQYRNPERLQEMRGTPAGSSPSGGGPAGGASGASGGPPAQQEDDKFKDILSESEIALIKELQAFLKKEAGFSKTQETATINPTAQRGFINAFETLNSERKAALGKAQGAKVPAIQAVASHIQSGLSAAEANPVGIRRMAVADTLKRVESETSANESLIQQLEKAVEKSKQLKKEKEEEEKKKKAEAEQMKKGPAPEAPPPAPK